MPLKSGTLSIDIVDTGDNHPIHYKVSSRTTKGATSGWHLVEILDTTFNTELTFRHEMLPQFIKSLKNIQSYLTEEEKE